MTDLTTTINQAVTYYIIAGGNCRRQTKISRAIQRAIDRAPTAAELAEAMKLASIVEAAAAAENESKLLAKNAEWLAGSLTDAERSEIDDLVRKYPHGWDSWIEGDLYSRQNLQQLRDIDEHCERELQREADDKSERAARLTRADEIVDWANQLIVMARNAGAAAEMRNSNLSEAVYVEISTYDESTESGETIKIRIADHDPRPTYQLINGHADLEIGNNQTAFIDGVGNDIEAAKVWLN